MQFLQYINPMIKWIPTLIFLLIIISATFTGFCRGYRKSLIFLIHSVIIGSICIALYFVFVKVDKMDEIVLNVINMIIGSDTGLQDLLEINQNAQTIKEVILFFLLELVDPTQGIGLILADNGLYLLTLIDLIYSIVFALVFYLLYIILNFIMAIIYFIFYSDRKYKKRNVKRVMKGKDEFGYSKKRLKGSLIGLTRGLVTGFLTMSLLGSVLFIVAGGPGDTKAPELDFGNEDFNNIYNAYSSISEYGTHGIFKILNTFKDNENVPYYLFAADIIFSGELKLDEEYSHNVVFREEFATYVSFSKDVLNLMMKYGAEDIKALVNGDEELDATDLVIKIMVNNEFQVEFEELINDFDSKVYISNFACAFIDSMLSHLDEDSLLGEFDPEISDLLSILFKEGYLSDSIPYEANLKLTLSPNEKVDLGHINSKDLLNKNNIIVIYKIIAEILYFNNVVEEDPGNVLYFEMMNNTVSNISDLTLLSPENSERFNNVFRRLYAYIRYNYLDVLEEEEEITPLGFETSKQEYYIDQDFDSIDWVNELRLLLSLVEDGLYLYQYSDLFSEEELDYTVFISQLFEIFNSEDEKFVELEKRLDKILDYITTSKLMANVVSSKIVSGTLEDIFVGSLEGFVMPELHFANIYDANGEFADYGETYYFFNTLRELLKNEENKKVLDLLMGTSETEYENETDLLLDICEVLTSEENEKTIEYLTSSKLFRSIFTSILDSIENDGEKFIYLDPTIVDLDSNGAKAIHKEEIKTVLYKIPVLMDIAQPFLEEEEYTDEQIADLLENEDLNDLLESKLIEGTVSNILVISLKGNEELIMPKYLENKEKGLITDENGKSEIKALIDINETLFKENNVGFMNILSGDFDSILDVFSKAEDLNVVFDSGIIYYTISNYLLDSENTNTDLLSFKLVIPASCRIEKNDDNLRYLVKKEELIGFFEIGKELFIDGDTGQEEDIQNAMIRKVVENNASKNDEKYLSNYILSASLMNFIYESESLKEWITLPKNFDLYIPSIETATSGSYYYDYKNIVHQEASKLCSALDELLGISTSIEPVDVLGDNTEVITNSISDILNVDDPSGSPDLDKFNKIYQSEIIACTLSKKFDDYLDSSLIDSAIKYSSVVYESDLGKFKLEEIEKFIYALNALGMSTPEEGTDGFGNSILALNEDNKQKVYDSVLAMGLVTKMIDDVVLDDANDLQQVDLAYQEEYRNKQIGSFNIYSECEINAFLTLLSGDNELENIINDPDSFSISTKSLEEIEDIVFNSTDCDSNGVSSYLIIGTATSMMIGSGDVYIPEGDYLSKHNIVNPSSFRQLLKSMEAAGFDLSLDFNSKDNQKFADNLDIIADSEILRATITNKIDISMDEKSITLVEEIGCIKTRTHNNKELIYLTKEEFCSFFTALDLMLEKQSSFDLEMNPIETVKNIAENENRTNILKSSIMRCVVNSMLEIELFEAAIDTMNFVLAAQHKDVIEQDPTDLIDFISYKSLLDVPQYSEQSILDILEYINENM